MNKAEYGQYLESEHWKQFSLRIKEQRRKCQDCGIPAFDAWKRDSVGLNVHHLTYENVGKEKDADVELLCRQCHMKRHGIEDFSTWCNRLSMPRASHGSQQACAICGVLTGPIYFNVDEASDVWLCADCRS